MRHSVLLIISGSIAAYKSLELIRRLREREVEVRCILTEGGAQFITPLAVASLSGYPTYGDLFSLKDEVEMGHIRLTREADLVVVAPASADLIAKMAQGRADDLATAALLASDKPVLVTPAMNAHMWQHPATQRNLGQIRKDGARLIEPGAGMLACGEEGAGRMAEVEVIIEAVMSALSQRERGGVSRGEGLSTESLPEGKVPHPNPLPMGEGMLRALVTSGPTHEPIDPVRYLGNRSSGKQGHAIAAALAARGVQVTLVTGPVALPDPPGVKTVHVTTAEDMLAACEKALPVDIAVCAAAVADWRLKTPAGQKMKKRASAEPPVLTLTENPDILRTLSHHRKRPQLVIGFAAETEHLLKNAAAKLKNKGCDWIVANDVSGGKGFDNNRNQVTLLTAKGNEDWPEMGKQEIAEKLVTKIAECLSSPRKRKNL